MTKLLERAIEAARALPASAQDELARVVLNLAESDDGVPITMTEDERQAIANSKAAAIRGEFANDAQVQAVWAKHK
jgi:uncharacterized protein YggE